MANSMTRTVVSLLPSATDSVIALQCCDSLIGISHECDWDGMEEGRRPSVVTRNRLGGSIPVEEIQHVFSASVAAVEEMAMLGPGLAVALIQYGLSVYHVDVETLVSLKPDVILTCLQTAHSSILEGALCDAAFHQVLGYVPEIVHTNGQTMEEIYIDMQRIATALGVSERGKGLVCEMQQRMLEISEKAKDACHGVMPRVACIQWPHPLLTCGAWVPELIDMVGARVVAGRDGPGGTIDIDEMAHADIVIFAICGLAIDPSKRAVERLFQKNRCTHTPTQAIMDGIRMMSRPGPLLLQSLECLAEIVHGLKTDRQHEGSSWTWRISPG